MVQQTLDTIYKSIPLLREFPSRHTWVDYDKEADVLYMNFEKPQIASDSVLQGDILIRRNNGKIIGLTIMNASKFKRK